MSIPSLDFDALLKRKDPASVLITFCTVLAIITSQDDVNLFILSDGDKNIALHYGDEITNQIEKLSIGNVYEFINVKYTHANGKLEVVHITKIHYKLYFNVL